LGMKSAESGMITDKNEKKFDFWNDHSLEFLEMAMKRDFQETVENPHGYGKQIRECGDTIEIFLIRDKGMLQSISYDLKGCLFSHTCVNTIIHFTAGKSIEQARKVTEQDIITYLKTLPKEETHCAHHALSAFNKALDDIS
jgi:nitrogen fixation protein NifU and related proteins